MAGLLGNFNLDDPQTMGLLNAGLTMLGNSGASRTPMNLGQILGGGLQAYTGTQDDFRKRKQQEEENAYMRQMREMQRQQSEMQMGELRRKNEMDAAIRGAYKDAYTPETQVANPEWNAVDQQSINLPQTLNKPANLDMRNLASKLMSVGAFDEAMAIQKQLRGENYKLGKGERLYGADNKLIAEGLVDAPKSDAITPYQAAQLALEERRLAQSNRQFQQSQDKPVFNAELGGFVSPKTGFTPISGGQQRPVKMTEDQAKATGWLVQAENAWKNMQEAGTSGKDAQGNFIVKSAAKPGFNDVLGAIPSFGLTGGIANTLRGSDRQKFMQSASSLSESLLRAATGAGVNKDEAAQKIAELTPQIGDSDDVVQQKMNSIPLYIESLKVRSGAGAGKVENILNKPVSGSGVRRYNPATGRIE